jgi:hypothetical protein
MKKVVNAWKEASEKLYIEIEAPFIYKDNIFPLMIKYFGTENGTLIQDMNECKDLKSIDIIGYYFSALNPICYEKYNNEQFIDTLEDWGWFGPEEKRPSWYNGKYYSK